MPLPDIGPNPANPMGIHDGSLPGDIFAQGQWQIVNGVLVLIPAPPGYYIPRGNN